MTNPDTSTLNGALEQLGITMADNLVTMGVSDADPSDGLTTLAGKILDIGPTPPTPTPASISLTGTKNILSYADSESSVLTATVLDDNDDPVEGATVELYKDNVLWDTLTTGSAGTVSKTYTSAGIGDVGFTVECGSLVTERYSLQDCLRYNALTSNDGVFNIPSGVTYSYGSSGLSVTNDNWKGVPLTDVIHQDYQFEFDITAINLQNNDGFYSGFKASADLSDDTLITNQFIFRTTGHYKFVIENNTVKWYKDNTLQQTETLSASNSYWWWWTGGTRTFTMKDLKIKPL